MAEVPHPGPADAGLFLYADLDGRVAVYDRRSGRTHLLDPLSAELLRLLEEDPAAGVTGASIRELLIAATDSLPSNIADDAVDDALAQLRQAGLVP